MQKSIASLGIFAVLTVFSVFATACGQSSQPTASSTNSNQQQAKANSSQPAANETKPEVKAEANKSDQPSGMATSSGEKEKMSSDALVSDDIRLKAEALFKGNCMTCHGETLEGKVGPNLQKVGSRKTKEEIVGKLTRQGKVMPNFKDKLDSESIEALAMWLAAKK